MATKKKCRKVMKSQKSKDEIIGELTPEVKKGKGFLSNLLG
jgi:hypothetical protein